MLSTSLPYVLLIDHGVDLPTPLIGVTMSPLLLGCGRRPMRRAWICW